MSFSLPDKKTALSWTLWFCGAILIGALGSGVWQSLLGPALHASARWVLDLTSFGLKSYKDGIYQQIAADNQSAVTVQTLSSVGEELFLFFGFYVAAMLIMYKEVRSRGRRILASLSDASAEPKSESTINQNAATIQRRQRIVRWLLYGFVVCMSFYLINRFIIFAQLSYISSADAHYHYVMQVAAPYLDAQERAEAESAFAQIGSREDYVKVLSALENKCTAHGRSVTKFDPW